MEKEYFERLIIQPESDSLDFKQEWHQDKATLIHDILCLANANTPKNRFIIFGIKDDKTQIGISKDQNRFNDHHLQDWLSKIHLNHLIRTKLHTYILGEQEFDLLEIFNIPLKPFSLTEDYQYSKNGKRVGAFRTYTRKNSKNTPINNNAHEDDVELMWRERFGIDKSPMERFAIYLEDSENWEKNYYKKPIDYYYIHDPEFKIIEGSKEGLKVKYRLCYRNTNFYEIFLSWHGMPNSKATPIAFPSIFDKKMASNLKYVKLDGEKFNMIRDKIGDVILKCNNGKIDLILSV